jgi:UDP-2-acetamido-2-deoxy-ribo-hexuluronate aminotransferase
LFKVKLSRNFKNKNSREKNMIPFVDLQTQFTHLENDIRAGIDSVLQHGKFIMGPEIQELEKSLADFAQAKFAITCSSGTDALLAPLMAWGIKPGDAVFTTPFTFIATAEVISLLGASPVFVDIDPETFNIDPEKLKLAIKAIDNNDSSIYPIPINDSPPYLKPKAIIGVDLFGLPADFDPIMKVAKEQNLFVLEDAAQGFGGEYKGRQAGNLGHAGAVSFFPAKPLGCYGDGGAIFTDDEEFAEIVGSIRVHGKGKDKYDNIRVGLNARLDTLQAAILIPKLKVFPMEISSRQRIAALYSELLGSYSPNISPPLIPSGLSSAWAQYSILADNRDAIQSALKNAGIPSAIYYPKPLHLQTAYSALGYKKGIFRLQNQPPSEF